MLNYLQVVSLAALFPMEWPQEVTNFFAVQSAISSASHALLSPDCELSWMVPADAFYQKQLGFAMVPIFIVSICNLFWRLARAMRCVCRARCPFCKRVLPNQVPPTVFYKDRAVISWVVLLYLSYPTLVKQGFAMLACERVAGGEQHPDRVTVLGLSAGFRELGFQMDQQEVKEMIWAIDERLQTDPFLYMSRK